MDQNLVLNKKDVVFQIFDDEVIIINLESGFYYSYGGAGADIWKMLQSGASFKEMDIRLKENYNGDMHEMTKILQRSLGELEREGLIVRDGKNNHIQKAGPGTAFPAMAEGKKPPFKAPKLERHEDMQDFLLVDPIHEIDFSEPLEKK